jgi:uncharacterized protein (TIGR00297 family)
MVLSLELATVGVVATGILAVSAVAARALTWPAGALAAVFGSIIVILAGFPFLILLVLFVAASSLATRYAFREKMRRHVQEGSVGERGISNVVAHILIPTGLVVVATVGENGQVPAASLAFLYACAIAFGSADTFASEFGVLSNQARSITTWEPVTAGTNGGVSTLGQLWAFIGAAATAIVGALAFWAFRTPQPVAALFVGGVLLAGFLSCQVDSLLGDQLENRGYLTKGGTNFLGMLSAVLIGVAILAAAGLPI